MRNSYRYVRRHSPSARMNLMLAVCHRTGVDTVLQNHRFYVLKCRAHTYPEIQSNQAQEESVNILSVVMKQVFRGASQSAPELVNQYITCMNSGTAGLNPHAQSHLPLWSSSK
ncbi:hypothetical protein DPX16_20702 [Anabarilius grahami]|uniref:Uncharacterized protein n=1 Tax=Anabarilius grahami TaxID=495550 RepID=A0A3N0YMB0_ANAGA|nr:hypothetical protein DPX16_20702 [Anabarilius grahami]